MILTYKVKLKQNNKQERRFFEYAGCARYVYNWVLDKEEKQYQEYLKNSSVALFLKEGTLRKELTVLKKQKGYEWLQNIDCNVAKQAVKDACLAYQRYFKHQSLKPQRKTKKRTKPSFYQDTSKIKIANNKVRLTAIANSRKKNRQKLNWVKIVTKNYIPTGEKIKYYNPRVSYDGINWWLTVGVERKESIPTQSKDGVGIDLGIKELAICSDGNMYRNINKDKYVRKLIKRKKRLQRCLSRKYEMNKVGKKYVKTKNIVKLEKQLLKLKHRITNIRYNYLQQVTTEIIKREPSFIVIEDLNVRGMMKNRHLARSVQEEGFSTFRKMIEYKAELYHIEVIVADRFYPSSKLCNNCGYKKVDLKLKDRTYLCSKCGYKNDRDINAALNLKDYKKKG